MTPELCALGVAFYDHMRETGTVSEYDARRMAEWYVRRKAVDLDSILVSVALADALALRAANRALMGKQAS